MFLRTDRSARLFGGRREMAVGRPLMTSANSDPRDAKITLTPEGLLMLSGGEAPHDKSKHGLQSLAWFSRDGQTWSERHDIGDPDYWLCALTWHKGTAYSFGYGCAKDECIRLFASKDGKNFKSLVDSVLSVGTPSETSLVFDGDTAYVCCGATAAASTACSAWRHRRTRNGHGRISASASAAQP